MSSEMKMIEDVADVAVESNIHLSPPASPEPIISPALVPTNSNSSANPMLVKLDELVAYITAIQGVEKITPMNVVIIVDKLVQIVEKYGDLTGTQKKMLVLDAIKKIVNTSQYLNDDERVTLIVIIDLTMPHVIDSIISAINGDMKFTKDKTKSWLSKLFCCGCCKSKDNGTVGKTEITQL
jgi:hypothetical protein